MDPTSIGLTVAWLAAVSRAQSQAVRDFAQQVPPVPLARQRTLSDMIESALVTAGAGPPPVAPGGDAGATHLVDRLA
jgi:hypothetical protein